MTGTTVSKLYLPHFKRVRWHHAANTNYTSSGPYTILHKRSASSQNSNTQIGTTWPPLNQVDKKTPENPDPNAAAGSAGAMIGECRVLWCVSMEMG